MGRSVPSRLAIYREVAPPEGREVPARPAPLPRREEEAPGEGSRLPRLNPPASPGAPSIAMPPSGPSPGGPGASAAAASPPGPSPRRFAWLGTGASSQEKNQTKRVPTASPRPVWCRCLPAAGEQVTSLRDPSCAWISLSFSPVKSAQRWPQLSAGKRQGLSPKPSPSV